MIFAVSRLRAPCRSEESDNQCAKSKTDDDLCSDFALMHAGLKTDWQTICGSLPHYDTSSPDEIITGIERGG